MASTVNSFAISGIEGYVVKIETDTIYGQPSISIIGLGDRAVGIKAIPSTSIVKEVHILVKILLGTPYLILTEHL